MYNYAIGVLGFSYSDIACSNGESSESRDNRQDINEDWSTKHTGELYCTFMHLHKYNMYMCTCYNVYQLEHVDGGL